MGRPALPNRRTPEGKITPEYRAWQAMLQRCYNPRVEAYPRYGGRGITVCCSWRESFDAFFAYVKKRPGPEYSLHRKNNDGNYKPSNVKWATDQEQNRCTSRNRSVDRRLLVEAAEQLGTSMTTIARRIDVHSWSERRAVRTKPRTWKHRTFTYKGRTLSLSAWSRRLAIALNTLRWRMLAGWSVKQMLSTHPSLRNRIK